MNRTQRFLAWQLAVIVLYVLLAPWPAAQSGAPSDVKPPALTELQKKDILLAAKDVEIWQLRAQQAASEYQKASEAMQKLVAAATPPGYRLNEKLEPVKIETRTAP